MADPSDALLDLPARPGRLYALAGRGLLDEPELERSLIELERRPSRASWSAYLHWHALLVGVILIVAGTIFFVAANWSALSGFAKLGIVGGMMVGATLAGGYLGESLAGRVTTLLGGLLFGPLAAVYGQLYQTGADAWELFAWWTAVLVAYSAATRFVGAWIFALVCAHVATFAWLDQQLGGDPFEGTGALIVAALALLDAALVVAAERLLADAPRERRALTHTAAFMGLCMLLPFGVLALIGEASEGSEAGVSLLVLALIAIWLVYRERRPEVGMLSAFAAVVTILVTAGCGKLLLEDLDEILFGIAALGVIVCGQVYGFTRWLLNWRREHPGERPPAPAPGQTGEPEPEPARRRPSLRELFALLERPPAPDDPRLRAALHDSEGGEAPALVRVFTAAGTWIGGLMFATVFAALELYESVPLALLLALAMFAGAIGLSRRVGRSLVETQLVWLMGLSANALLTMVMFELELREREVVAVLSLSASAMVFAVRVPSYQLSAALCAVGFATWLAMELQLPAAPLWVALPAAAIATAVWVFEVPLAARLGRTWLALAYGLPIALAGPLSLAGLGAARGPEASFATLALLALLGLVLARARRELGGELETRAYALGLVLALAGLAARHVPGLTLALLWLLLAHLRRSPGLQTIASIQLAGFLFFFYYQLDTSLLLKSLWVVSTGLVLLLGAFLARPAREPGARGEPRRARWLPAIALASLSSALVVVMTVHKQRILAEGQVVLLELAPVDPRSLMQGDYMDLRYALESELRGRDSLAWDLSPPEDMPRHGHLVVHLDPDRVGHFSRLDTGAALGADELRLEYRLRHDWGTSLRIGGESYFFEEGSAELYEDARYGELVVAEDGEVVLIGLRDEQRRPLGVRLHGLPR